MPMIIIITPHLTSCVNSFSHHQVNTHHQHICIYSTSSAAAKYTDIDLPIFYSLSLCHEEYMMNLAFFFYIFLIDDQQTVCDTWSIYFVCELSAQCDGFMDRWIDFSPIECLWNWNYVYIYVIIRQWESNRDVMVELPSSWFEISLRWIEANREITRIVYTIEIDFYFGLERFQFNMQFIT